MEMPLYLKEPKDQEPVDAPPPTKESSLPKSNSAPKSNSQRISEEKSKGSNSSWGMVGPLRSHNTIKCACGGMGGPSGKNG